MHKLVCKGPIASAFFTSDENQYSHIIDFKWSISVADQYANCSIYAKNNNAENPYLTIAAPACSLEYESRNGAWKIESDGTPAGTSLFFGGKKVECMIQVLEVVAISNITRIIITACGLSAHIGSTPGQTTIGVGDMVLGRPNMVLGKISRAVIKCDVANALNEFTIDIEDDYANL